MIETLNQFSQYANSADWWAAVEKIIDRADKFISIRRLLNVHSPKETQDQQPRELQLSSVKQKELGIRTDRG